MSEGFKILIVDDLQENLFVLERTLRKEGAKIIKAESGLQALECALQDDFVLILLDVMMPHMDGFETAELLRESPRTKYTPIIFITGMDRHENNTFKGYDAGAVDFIYKPFEPHVLRSKVRIFLELAKQKQEVKNSKNKLAKALELEQALRLELEEQNKELIKISINDGLTGLYNRRFLSERLIFEFRRAKRYRTPLSCLMLDIDHFKLINDSLGHQFGDLVLVELAKILRALTREVDVVGRYGGEEFVIVMTNTHLEGARILADNLLVAVSNHIFSDGNLSRQVTISIGITSFTNDMCSENDLISCADAALYEAKENGRNRFVVWQSPNDRELSKGSNELMHTFKYKCACIASQVQSTYLESVSILLNAIDAKDNYTRSHAIQVAYFAVEIGKRLRFNERRLNSLRFAAMLQDVGKITIDTDLLIKEMCYDDHDIAVMQAHPQASVDILEEVRFLSEELPAILHHHEHFDGSGYPHGLSGEDIPIDARILSIADAYSAMITPRNFAKTRSADEAFAEIKRCANTQFDANLVEVFESVHQNESKQLSQHCKRILVADDEVEVLEVYKALLEPEGFEVTTAHNGLEAIGYITNTLFSLLILDIDMPVMTGIDVINKASESDLNNNTPIIVVTGFGCIDIVDKCKDLGVDYFFKKPFDISEILKAVYEFHLPRRQYH